MYTFFKRSIAALITLIVLTLTLTAIPSVSVMAMDFEKPVYSYPNNGGYYGWLSKPVSTYHVGIDFPAPAGTNVYAIRDGIVRVASTTASGYGQLSPSKPGPAIVIAHKDDDGNTFYALYGHASFNKDKIYVGAEVKKGDTLGQLISFWNGSIYCPHLHFGINTQVASVVAYVASKDNVGGWVNPVNYLNTKSAAPVKPEPKVIYANPKQDTVKIGETVMLYAKTNDAVSSVALLDEKNAVLSSTKVPATHNNNEKEWDFGWQPKTAGNLVLKIRAYDADTKYADYTIRLTVTANEPPKPRVTGISLSNDTPAAGETIAVTVYTNIETTTVCLVNEQQEKVAETASGSVIVGGQKKWSVPWGISKAGVRQIAVYAGDSTGYQWERAYMEWFFVTVQAAQARLKIDSITVANPHLYVGEYCWMTVVTSADITDMWIVNETGGSTVYALVNTYAVGANKGWDIGWLLGKAGSRTGYIVATNGKDIVKKAFNCTVYD
jgi:hypothetical protein